MSRTKNGSFVDQDGNPTYLNWDTEKPGGTSLIAPGDGYLITPDHADWPSIAPASFEAAGVFQARTTDPLGNTDRSRCEVGQDVDINDGQLNMERFIRWYTWVPSDFAPTVGKPTIIADYHSDKLTNWLLHCDDGVNVMLRVSGGFRIPMYTYPAPGPKPPQSAWPAGTSQVEQALRQAGQTGATWFAEQSWQDFPICTVAQMRGKISRFIINPKWHWDPTIGHIRAWFGLGKTPVVPFTNMGTMFISMSDIEYDDGTFHVPFGKLGAYRPLENTGTSGKIIHFDYGVFNRMRDVLT
jgi:hypothetical protein